MDPKIERDRLTNAVPIEPEVMEAARQVFKDAKRKLAISKSTISSIMVSLCHVAFTRSDKDPDIKTLAVKLTGDGNPLLMINPDFLIEIGADQAVFGFAHEAYHLLMRHLHTDIALRADSTWITAEEACINFRVMQHTGLPLIKQKGEVAIVDPDKVYDQYRTGARKDGFDPVSKADFYKTDMGCYAELCRLSKPPKQKQNTCVHANDSEGGDGDGQGGNAPVDQAEAEKFADSVLQKVMQEVKNGQKDAREEILGFMDAAPENTKMWGDLGAGALRGETVRTRRSDLWEKWTADIVGTKLQDGNRLRYNKKVPWDPRVSAKGKQPRKHGAVFVDASGSMHQEVLDKVAALIGDMEELSVEWHSFDGEVWPFSAGEPFRGGGGTSFQIIDDHVQNGGTAKDADHDCCEEDLDFILVITDGWAPHIRPVEADKWIWLITPGGEEWPHQEGMSCRVIDLP